MLCQGEKKEEGQMSVFQDTKHQAYFLLILKKNSHLNSTLLESLSDSFGEPELLSVAEGNGWRPEKGADKVDAHKGSSLVAKGLPPILQCHLKRFNYDWQTDTMTKLNNRFDFPDVLDLSTLCNVKGEKDKDLTIYDLQSIVIHMGEYGVGHYCEYFSNISKRLLSNEAIRLTSVIYSLLQTLTFDLISKATSGIVSMMILSMRCPFKK